MYILKCCDDSYYTGSTKNLELRLQQHQAGEGANHTKKRLPVELVYFEEFQRIDEAFYREKQVQGWSRKKKEALIEQNIDRIKSLAKKQFLSIQMPLAFTQGTDYEDSSEAECFSSSLEYSHRECIERKDEKCTEGKGQIKTNLNEVGL